MGQAWKRQATLVDGRAKKEPKCSPNADLEKLRRRRGHAVTARWIRDGAHLPSVVYCSVWSSNNISMKINFDVVLQRLHTTVVAVSRRVSFEPPSAMIGRVFRGASTDFENCFCASCAPHDGQLLKQSRRKLDIRCRRPSTRTPRSTRFIHQAACIPPALASCHAARAFAAPVLSRHVRLLPGSDPQPSAAPRPFHSPAPISLPFPAVVSSAMPSSCCSRCRLP